MEIVQGELEFHNVEIGRLESSAILTADRAPQTRCASSLHGAYWCDMSYQLESSYRPRGDQAQAIAKLAQIGRGRQSPSDAARRDGFRARPSRSPTSSANSTGQPSSSPTTRRWPRSFTRSSSNSSRRTRSNISSATSIITSRKPTFRVPTPTSKRIRRLTRRSSGCGFRPPSSLLSRRDTIVVASVSCIYGVTSPEDYLRMLLTVKRGQQISREAVLGRLVDMLYERNDVSFVRGKFRVRGDVVEVYPATADEEAIRLEFFGDELDAITRFDPLTGHAHESLGVVTFLPGETIRHARGQTEPRPHLDPNRA